MWSLMFTTNEDGSFTVPGCYRFDLDSHPGVVFIGLDSRYKMRSVIKILDIDSLSLLAIYRPSGQRRNFISN